MAETEAQVSKEQLLREIESLRRRGVELEKSEEAARRAGGLLHIFRINSPICLFVLQDGKFVFANKQFQKLLGIDMEELTESYSLDLVHPEDRESVRKNAIAMLKGELTRPYVYRIISRDNRIRWLEEGVVSVVYQGKRAVLGHSVDITDRIKNEEELR
ncbi:MAG: PAS domain S-box protein, partial [Dehalococcoidia bacterium]|nr:PAS domain S-box protein [Dehalococcoidia bacterium]